MPVIDQTSDHLRQGLGQLAGVLSSMTDPRNRAALEQARMERELYPLKRQGLEQQIALHGAQALTEGAQQALLGAKTTDQTTQTGFRQRLGGAFDVAPLLPQQPPSLAPVVQQFNAAINATPGAAEAIAGSQPAMPMAPPQAGVTYPPNSAAGAMMPSVPMAPNPLLPPASGYSPQQLAAFAAAASESPNPDALMSSLARAEALNGGVSEARARELMLGQGMGPTVNTAVTPGWQGALVDNKNAAAMDRVGAQQDGAMQRTIVSPLVKSMFGGSDGANDIGYTDLRHMSTDAGGIADRTFGIQRDDAGNAVNITDPNVLAQRDALAARTVGHIKAGMDPVSASKKASVELFGSANFGDANHFNQPQSNWLTSDRPFSARNVNPDALAPVSPTGGAGVNPAAAAMLGGLLSRLGLGGAGEQTIAPNIAPIVPTPLVPSKSITPPPDNTFVPRPSGAEVEQRKKNDSRAAELKQQVAQIESVLRSGHVAVPTAPPGFTGQYDEKGWALVPSAAMSMNDTYNDMLARRQKMLDELASLEGKSGGDSAGLDESMQKYLPR